MFILNEISLTHAVGLTKVRTISGMIWPLFACFKP